MSISEIQRPTPIVSAASDNTVRYTFASPIGAGRLVGILILGQVSAGAIANVKGGASGFDPTLTGTSFSAAAASASLISGTVFAQVFYLPIAPSGIVDVVATFTAAPGTYVKGIGGYEVDGFTNPVLDTAGNVTTGVAGGTTTLAGMALTASAAAWGCALVATNGLSVTANPAAGNAWTAGGDIWVSPNAASASIILASAGSTTPNWTASAANASYLVSGALFKESSGGGGGGTATNRKIMERGIERGICARTL
jgi:hypothetical protein